MKFIAVCVKIIWKEGKQWTAVMGDLGMFQIGEKVMYGVHGVCLVAAQEVKQVAHKTVTYLVLEPLGKDSARYLVPVQNPAALAKLRRMLSREELYGMLESQEVKAGLWVEQENLRKQSYRELISGTDTFALMQAIYAAYRHREAQAAARKKLHQCDENFLRDAEKVLVEEIAQVLDLTQSEAKQLLRSKLQ